MKQGVKIVERGCSQSHVFDPPPRVQPAKQGVIVGYIAYTTELLSHVTVRRVQWASIAAHRRCSMEGCCTTIVGTFRW